MSRRICVSTGVLVGSPWSGSEWIDLPSQSISPLLHLSTFFWYQGGYKALVRGVVATVVTKAMTINMLKVVSDRIPA